MIFDVKKVTYNTYSCSISGMSREMLKMDGRDSAECQNWGKDIDVILEFVLNELNDKIVNSAHLLHLNQEKNVKEKGGGGSCSELQITFLEREEPLSL